MGKTTMTRRGFIGGLATLGVLGLTACGGSGSNGSDGASGEAKELVLYPAVSPATLDPQNDSNSDDQEITGLLGEGLFRYSADGQKPEKALCDSYEVSADGLTYTFTLKDSAWQDGSAVTAGDFVYGLRRFFSPELASENASSYLTYVKGAADVYNGKADSSALGVEAPDDKTLKVTLGSALPSVTVEAFFTNACVYPMNQKAIEAGGDGWSTSAESHLSNGAYKLSEYNPDESVVLVKNDAYKGDATARAEKITFRFYADSSAADVAMGNGELDYYKNASDSLVAQVGSSAVAKNVELLSTACLFMNWRCAPLDNPKVREAIFRAVDAGYVNETLEGGHAVVAKGFVGDKFSDPQGGSFRSDSNALVPDYSDGELEKAKQLLAEAGYPDGTGLPKLVYMTSNSTVGTKRAEFFQALLKDNLGVEVEVAAYDTPTYLSKIGGSDYAFSYMSLNASCDNATELLANFTSDSDTFGVSIPEYDAAFAELQATADAAKQSELMHKAESILLADSYAFRPIVYSYVVDLFGSKVDESSVTIDPTGLALHNYLARTGW